MRRSMRRARVAETLLRRGKRISSEHGIEWVGDIQAGDGERGKRFIQSADHDTAFVAPCRRCAAVSEKGTDIPRQEGKANDPEGGVDGVDGEINFRREGA